MPSPSTVKLCGDSPSLISWMSPTATVVSEGTNSSSRIVIVEDATPEDPPPSPAAVPSPELSPLHAARSVPASTIPMTRAFIMLVLLRSNGPPPRGCGFVPQAPVKAPPSDAQACRCRRFGIARSRGRLRAEVLVVGSPQDFARP
jgi:hypothetical protein